MSAAQPGLLEQTRATALQELGDYSPSSDQQRGLQQRFLRHLRAQPEALWRDGPPAHLTAGVLVLDHTGERVLLTLHRKARRWFQLGGHLQIGDTSLWAAAAREAREESGIETLRVSRQIVELHAHLLGAQFGHCREHLDVRFAGWAPPGAHAVISPESLELAWWPVDALPETSDRDLPELIRAAHALDPATAAAESV